MSKSPISPPESFALAFDRLHEVSSMGSCIAAPSPSRRSNTRSTIRTRSQHSIAHPFLKTAYHLQRLSLHPLSHTETNAFNEIPKSQTPYQYRSQMTRRNLGKFQLKGRQNTKFSSAERHVRQGDDYIESRENGAYCKTEHFLGKRETSPLALPQTHRPWHSVRRTLRP